MLKLFRDQDVRGTGIIINTPALPIATINMNTCKIEIRDSFPVKDELKSLGAKYESLNKTWYFLFKTDEELVETLNKLNALSNSILVDGSGWNAEDALELSSLVPWGFLVIDYSVKRYVDVETVKEYIKIRRPESEVNN